MPAAESITGEKATRKRRAHRKSRQGCRNCKIRRVKVSKSSVFVCGTNCPTLKCDETRPRCQKCSSYGVLCNYDTNALDLETSIQDGPKWKLQDTRELTIRRVTEAPAPPLWVPIICADATTSFELDRQCIERLNRFRTRTVSTLGTSIVVNIYKNELPKLALSVCRVLNATCRASLPHTRTVI